MKYLSFRSLSWPLVGAVNLFTACTSKVPDKSKSPNFIVILTDDQNWVGTSFLMDPDEPRSKSDYYQTPNMERLARMGMRFTDGYASSPQCYATRRCILTGMSPPRHIMQKDTEVWTAEYRKQLSIPQMLKQTDPAYKTAHFGKWDTRYDQVPPDVMGYDYSDGYTNNDTGGSNSSIEWPAALDDPKLIFSITDRSVKFMEEQVKLGNPFYLQVSHYAVHLGITYTQKSIEKYRNISPGTKHQIPEFAAMTEDMDTGIGILIDKAEELELLDNTYIIFLSDNGGRTSLPLNRDQKISRNFPLRGGKGNLYEGGIRVPFIVTGPGIKPNSISRVPVTATDIFPTLADIAGYEKILPDVIDGGSFKDVIHNNGAGEIKRNLPYLIFHHNTNMSAIREGNYKLTINWRDDLQHKIELFNLAEDISEANDLSKEMPELAEDLHNKLVGYLKDTNAVLWFKE